MEPDKQIQLLPAQAVSSSVRGTAQTGEPDSAETLRAYWRIVQKRRWSVITVALIVFLSVLLWTVKQRPSYEAKALLEIEPENPNIVTVQKIFQIQNITDDYLDTQYKLLQSETLARDVIQQLHLGQVKEFNGSKTRTNSRANEQAVLKNFANHLTIMPIPRSRLVQVKFDSGDPNLAAKAVNTLAESYIAQNLRTRWNATQEATKWLGQQLGGLKAKLEKSEDSLQQYARENGLIYFENDKGQAESLAIARLKQMQDELIQAQAERYQAESVFHLSEAGDYGALPGVFDNRVTQDLTERLEELEQEQAQLAPTFKAGYPKMKEVQSQIKRTKQVLDQRRSEAERHIADQFFAAVHREDLVKKAFAEQEKQANLDAQKSVEYNILKREVDTNKQVYEALLQQMKEAGVSATLKASNVRVVDAAVPPASPVKPRVALNLTLGFVLGLAGGIGFACLQERMDNTVKSPDDVAHFLHLPTLGLIPREAASRTLKINRLSCSISSYAGVECGRTRETVVRSNGWIHIDSLCERSDLREAFRVLRTSLLLSSTKRPPQSLAFVSAEANEGKTTICCNLAISLTQIGKRVLVIDGDIRHPGVQDFFDARGSSGLVNYLAGEPKWRSFVQSTAIRGLDCLICGPERPSSGELLSSERMRDLIRDATTDYDFVLVDAPPLLSVTDSRIVAAVVEGSILVVKAAVTSRERVQRAHNCAAAVGAHVIGTVLNNMKLDAAGYCQTGYYPNPELSVTEPERVSA